MSPQALKLPIMTKQSLTPGPRNLRGGWRAHAGEYTLQYSCQYAWNSPIIFNPPGNFGGLDPRITGVLPNFQNGLFGPPGNGGNLGRRLLRGWHF